VRDESAGCSIPRPPQTCGVDGCTNDTQITMAVCRVGTSGPIVGSLILPSEKDKGERHPPRFSRRVKGGFWADTTDFQFIRWISRCADCYVREQRPVNDDHERIAA
jgi:hypothetical protein